VRVALLVGELYARVTSDSSAYRRDMQQVDAQGAASARLAEQHGLKIANARKQEETAAGRVRVALAALEDLRNKGGASASQLAAAEERLAAAKRALAAATDKTTAAQTAAVAAQEKAAAKATELAAKEAEAGRQIEFADRHAAKFTATLLGMAAAGGGAGVAVAGGLALVPLLLAGIAAAALKADDTVSEAYGNLASEGREAARRIAEPLRDELVTAAGQATTGLRRITPELRAMAEEGGPAVTLMVDGFVRLAVNAMPGARRAMSETTTVAAGLNAMLDRTGTGLGNFFDEISEGAPQAGRAAGDAGRLVEDLLGTLGALAADLAQQGAGPWSQFVGVVDQTTDAATALGDTALPSVASSASTVLSVVSRVLDVLGPLAPLLGTIGGVMLSYRAGAAIVGVAGDALARLGGRLESTTVGSSRTTGAVRGLGSALGVIGPYGAIAAGALLAVDAAATAAFGSTDQLAQGLMAGGNAAEQATSKLVANTMAVKAAETAGGGMAGMLADLFIPIMQDAEKAVSEQRASMTTLQRAEIDAKAAAADHSLAVERFGATSDEARAASVLLAQKQSELKRAQQEAADATKTLNDRLIENQAIALGLASDNLRLRMATTSYEDSQKRLNDVLKSGTATELEVRAARQANEQAALAVIDASRQETLARYENQESAEAQAEATNVANKAALDMALTASGPVPQALATFIAGLDAAALSALGVTREVDGTKLTIRTLEGKTVTIDVNDLATNKAYEIKRAVESLPESKSIDVHIKQLLSTVPIGPEYQNADLGNPAAVLPPPRRASGGPVLRGHYYEINEDGREYFVPGQDGTILNADKTAKLMDILAGAESGALAMQRGGGRTIVIEQLNLNGVPTIPTAEQLRNALHDLDVKYGDD
jgi:hypothetical protein